MRDIDPNNFLVELIHLEEIFQNLNPILDDLGASWGGFGASRQPFWSLQGDNSSFSGVIESFKVDEIIKNELVVVRNPSTTLSTSP